MSCRNCGSDRIAFLQAHSKDLSILEVPHLELENDGYFPNIPGVCSGDDADFFFCLECGMIQSDTFPITDETVKAAFRDDDGWEDDWEDEDKEPANSAYRLDDNSMDEYKYAEQTDFQTLYWVADIRAKEGFYKWALTTAPSGTRILLAAFYLGDEENPIFEKVAKVPENFYRYTELEWDAVVDYLKGEE